MSKSVNEIREEIKEAKILINSFFRGHLIDKELLSKFIKNFEREINQIHKMKDEFDELLPEALRTLDSEHELLKEISNVLTDLIRISKMN